MKTDVSTSATSVSLALDQGTCALCAGLKHYQWTLSTSNQPSRDLRLCNFHCWSPARSRGSGLSRSTPGEAATDLFLEMLRGSAFGRVAGKDRDLCRRVLEEEAGRLRELGKKFPGASSQWVTNWGMLCVDHTRKLKEFVPLNLRKTMDEILERNRALVELEACREQLKQGNHEGGGLLGRVAEFLVGQRGL